MPQDLVKRFFTGTGATYELIVNLFTYGADRHWKNQILAKIPPSHSILDLACGTGILTLKLADRFPQSKIVGVDMMVEYIAIAKRKVVEEKRRNIRLICGRAEQVQLRETFDCITSSYIPKYIPAEKLLANISRYLKPGGKLVLHDFALPRQFVLVRIWALHVFLMKHFGTLLFPNWKTVFYELGDLVRETKWIDEYLVALPKFGYRNIAVQRLTAGSAAIICAEKELGLSP
jgi:demethylmenaquinone methyltransferase/2-methoxy-6-polyprenyl-1,4-benzoquinol methylase